MVITVTLNPAMDKTVVLDGLQVGEVNRLLSARNDMGGKGINVSKVLNEFKVPSTAIGFLGGALEENFRKELKRLGISDQFISISGETRTNIKIVDEKNKTYTDLNERGPQITKGEINKFLKVYESLLKDKDIVVLSGGLCPGVSEDFYGTLTKIAKDKGAYVIVDAEGEALKYALTQKPHLIKPNEIEFSGLYGEIELSEEEMIFKAKQLIHKELDKVLISRGEKGSLLITKNQVLVAKALQVPVKSTVGAGDSMVSALVYSFMHNLSDKDTIAMAQSAGASAVMTEGTKACTIYDVEKKLELAKEKIEDKTNEYREYPV